MNSQTILLVFALAGASPTPEMCHFSLKEMALPVSKPRISVVDGNGKELPHDKASSAHEFSKIQLRVPVIPGTTGSYWLPEDVHQAAIGLKVMLPTDFYHRLLKGYGGTERKWTALNDPEISERWDDLVVFLDSIWGEKWSDEKKPYDQARELINYSIRSDVRVPDDCDSQRKDNLVH